MEIVPTGKSVPVWGGPVFYIAAWSHERPPSDVHMGDAACSRCSPHCVLALALGDRRVTGARVRTSVRTGLPYVEAGNSWRRWRRGPRALLESPSPSSGGTIVGVRLARREQRASIPRPVPFKGSAPRIRIATRFADGIGSAPAGLTDIIRTGLSTATVVPPANFLVPRECAATCTSCRALTIAKVGFKLVRFDVVGFDDVGIEGCFV